MNNIFQLKKNKNTSNSHNKIESYSDIFNMYSSKPRFIEETVKFKMANFIVPDAPSFAYQVKDIFIDGVYSFKSDNDKPIIYDCGANIGVSILYFKEHFPNAIIKAFEADKKICEILIKNTSNINGLEIFNNAVWINNDDISFNAEGADGGSIINSYKDVEIVKAIRLKDILKKERCVDFLKIDIEGAEYEVIKDCQRELKNVDRIFIEYHSFLNEKQKLGEILNILSEAGFRYYIKNVNEQPNVYNKRNIWNNMDLQVNLFGYRI